MGDQVTLRSQAGDQILTIDDWHRCAPPKRNIHWQQGRSAWELANAWCSSGTPMMPSELKTLLDSCNLTEGVVIDEAIAECQIRFDELRGEPRNANLALVGTAGGKKIAITIEAKADEPFGELVGDALSLAIERGVENHRSGAVQRIDGLARALFRARQGREPKVSDLRYQLLTAAAATVAFAKQRNASIAVFVVHEFVTDETKDELHRRNSDDLKAFLERLSGQALPLADTSQLLGPFVLPSSELFPEGGTLWVGKIRTNRRERHLRGSPIRHTGPLFNRYIGVDYSGAEVPDASLKGLRVYSADKDSAPREVPPPVSPKRYWTRKGIAHWLVEQLSSGPPTIVGIDHGFSFPIAYFDRFGVSRDWNSFLDDFCAHWPTDDEHVYVDFVRDGACGNGAARLGQTKWRRVTEVRSKAAKSLFHFDVQGSVAKSTHAGLPWLRFIRRHSSKPVHFWPFDGWKIPEGSSAIVEVYPRRWNRDYPAGGRTPDQHDAWVVAEWMRSADFDGRLREALRGPEPPADRVAAAIEGWILGV